MELSTFWFILVAVLWTGYFILEGFDFGVGLLMTLLSGKRYATDPEDAEKRRRVMLNTIGPVWDGNEVWVITAGGAMFAAFPHWYATLFSAAYLPLLLILVALIVRNMGIDYRGKRSSASWRRGWDAAIFWGSLLPALLWGDALTSIVRGLPINEHKEFTGSLLAFLHPLSLLGGITFVAVFLCHGAMFLALKTGGPIQRDARTFATRSGLVAAVLAVVLLLWLGIQDGKPASWVTTVVAAVALLAGIYLNVKGRDGLAFTGTALAIAMAVATYFLMLFPNVMPSSTNPAWSLTTTNASSTHYTLQIMTIVAAVFTPVMLVYTAWTYWVFRKRITVESIPAPVAVH